MMAFSLFREAPFIGMISSRRCPRLRRFFMPAQLRYVCFELALYAFFRYFQFYVASASDARLIVAVLRFMPRVAAQRAKACAYWHDRSLSG